MSSLFLSDMLAGWDLSKGESQTSEVRGGKYAARVQEGLEKDGSPKYRYFKTQGEYEDYMSGKKGKDAKSRKKDKAEVSGKAEESGSTRLDKMREKEQKESNRKKRALFSENKKKKQEVETTKKGLRLYIEVEE